MSSRSRGSRADDPHLSVEVGRAIALAPQKRLMLFSGRSNPGARVSGSPSSSASSSAQVELKTFANGETYCRYAESIRGADMFIVQTACDPVDRNLMELL